MIVKGQLKLPLNDCFIGFDAEWTKNYKIKNGNIPFCFSIVAVEKKHNNIGNLKKNDAGFEYIQYYCQNKDETSDLISLCDFALGQIRNSLNTCVLCGHQISSDFSVFYNNGNANGLSTLDNISYMQMLWHQRKVSNEPAIIDTRYDVIQDFLGKSRRLVDMCNDFLLDVSQPELHNTSMTKLQNTFYDKGDISIYERVAVMNLRHSLCAIILSGLNDGIKNGLSLSPANINKIVYKNLKNEFAWVGSSEFAKLL